MYSYKVVILLLQVSERELTWTTYNIELFSFFIPTVIDLFSLDVHVQRNCPRLFTKSIFRHSTSQISKRFEDDIIVIPPTY